MKTIQARYFYRGRRRPIRLIVVHSMEAPEKGTTAESCARWFADPDTRRASAHICVDSNSAVRCVKDGDTAWAASGANADGLHVELAGYARQNADQWLDEFGLEMLELAAREVIAPWCASYDIPPRWLTVSEVRRGASGICDHATVTAAFPPGSGHTDPGPGFPAPYLINLVRAELRGDPQPEDDDMTPAQAQKLDEVHAMLSALVAPRRPDKQDRDPQRLDLGDLLTAEEKDDPKP